MYFNNHKPKKAIVTGAGGLIGSEVVEALCKEGYTVCGIDNNMRADFFGPNGDTTDNIRRLSKKYNKFTNVNIDIRDRFRVASYISMICPDVIVHTAAQPSHDLAASRPFDDFDVNAGGTLNLLEAVRNYCPNCVFVHMSTNKVYRDAPNDIQLIEKDMRYDFLSSTEYYKKGIPETFRIDHSKHSIFGASKVSADIMVQEYGRYFSIPTCCLRGGCLTGPNHSGVELHGFLSYLIKCNLTEKEYSIFGYNGKQVRDNIHSYDVSQFILQFIENPKCAAVYNIGGGYDNSVSILEAFEHIENISGKKMLYNYVDKPRSGDHICYYSDLSKMKKDFPHWKITKSVEDIFQEIYISWEKKINN